MNKDVKNKSSKVQAKKEPAKKKTSSKKSTKKASAAKAAPASVDEEKIPVDLRGERQVGRPSNKERASSKKIQEDLLILCSSWLTELRGKKGKNLPIEAKAMLLPKFMKLIVFDERDDDDDLNKTRELLGRKYVEQKSRYLNSLDEAASVEAPTASGTKG